MALHNELGKRGEKLAEDYLRKNGYRIIECNWTFGKYEIDIIASVPGFIVFIEVKTRSSAIWGNPEDAISRTRIKRLVEAADFYIKEKDIDGAVRFDVIAIVDNREVTEIEHIEDAFFAPVE